MSTGDRRGSFIPALRFHRLTALYDPIAAVTTRERRFKSRVLEHARPRDGESVLDVGCGTGTLAIGARAAAPGAHVVGLDPDPAVLERARAKARSAGAEVELVEGSATKLPFDEASFDVALSSLVFHHLADEAKHDAAAEIVRVLRPGGRLVLADFGRPQDPLMRVAVLGVQLLDGFETTSLNVAGSLPEVLRGAGLAGVSVRDRMRTPVGTIEIVTGSKS